MAVAPSADNDEELAEALVREISKSPHWGVLDARRLTVEARSGTAFRAPRASTAGSIMTRGHPWSVT